MSVALIPGQTESTLIDVSRTSAASYTVRGFNAVLLAG